MQEQEINYHKRKTKRKPFIIQCSWMHWGSKKWGEWRTWGRYATERDRAQAFKDLSKKDRTWWRYRIKPCEKQ